MRSKYQICGSLGDFHGNQGWEPLLWRRRWVEVEISGRDLEQSGRLLCEPHPGRSFQWLMVKSDSESCLKFYTNQGLIFFSRVWVPQRVFVCAQLSPTWCDPMDCSLPGSSIHRILQVRILEWIAISFSRGSSWPRDWTHVFASPALAGGLFTTGSPGKPLFGEQLMVIHRGWWQWLWWGW